MSHKKTLTGRIGAAMFATVLAGALAVPAQAQRVSLADLQARIQALQEQLDALTGTPCPPGQALVAVNPDGTPVCRAFVPDALTFSFDFVQGTAGIDAALNQACPLWQGFVADAFARGGGGSLTVTGSAGAPRTCSDPARVAEIVAAMDAAAAGPVVPNNSAVIECEGFNWSISNFCAGNPPGAPQVEVKVSPAADPVPSACACQAAGADVYVVRPCIGNQNWGGVGTNVCSAPDQTIEVTLQ